MSEAMQWEKNTTAWESWYGSKPEKNQEDPKVEGGLGHSPCLPTDENQRIAGIYLRG